MLHLIFTPCNAVLALTILLPLGGYNPDEYEDLPVGPEVVPAIGDIDEFIKVNANALACGQQHLDN